MDAIEVSELHDSVANPPDECDRAFAVPEPEALAEEHERRVRDEKNAQFKRLKDEARAIFGQVRGLPGVRSPMKWAAMLEKAGDEIGNGRFIVRQLGAERYLDPETVAVLITLRQNLLADMKQASAADIMMVDAAVIAYFNMLRVQGWIGNLSLVVERGLFGQAPLTEIHAEQTAKDLEEHLRRLSETMLPLQDRAHKMMARSLAAAGRA